MSSPRKITAALGLPVSPSGKVMLTQRYAPDYPSWHLHWQLAGGAVAPDEDLQAAVLRELWEELHVRATILHPEPIYAVNSFSKEESDEGEAIEVHLNSFIVDIGNQYPDLSADPDWETIGFGWFTLDEIKILSCLPSTVELVDASLKVAYSSGILENNN